MENEKRLIDGNKAQAAERRITMEAYIFICGVLIGVVLGVLVRSCRK